jgi:Ras-related protein Rab-1A
MEEEYDHLFKILLIGDSAVGKTSLLLRYVDDTFNSEFQTTIGVDFKISTLNIDGKIVKLQLWDTAGQDRFRNIVASYYRGAHGIIIMYDITNPGSLDSINKWYEETQSYLQTSTPKLLVGNKLDRVNERAVASQKGEELAERLGMQFIETSAKNSTNVKQAFETMTRMIIRQVSTLPTTLKSPNTKISAGKNVKKGYCC